MTSNQKMVVACIPAYNEEKSIARIVIESLPHVSKILVCDDGSSDLTGEIASRLGATVVKHGRNTGYGSALRSLFDKAKEMGADTVVTLDGDGQHSPADIPKLLKPVADGESDIVVGSRFLGGSDIPGYRRVGVKTATSVLKNLTGLDITDAQSGFRAYSKKALGEIKVTEDGMGAGAEILQKAAAASLRISEVPIKIDYTVESPSTHNPAYHFADVMASLIKHYSIRHPLLFYGVPGLVLIIIGFAFGFIVLDIQSTRHVIAVGTALISLGAFIIGILLALTGLLLFTIINVLREGKD